MIHFPATAIAETGSDCQFHGVPLDFNWIRIWRTICSNLTFIAPLFPRWNVSISSEENSVGERKRESLAKVPVLRFPCSFSNLLTIFSVIKNRSNIIEWHEGQIKRYYR